MALLSDLSVASDIVDHSLPLASRPLHPPVCIFSSLSRVTFLVISFSVTALQVVCWWCPNMHLQTRHRLLNPTSNRTFAFGCLMSISSLNIPTGAPTTLFQSKLTPLTIYLISIKATPFFWILKLKPLKWSLTLCSQTSNPVCQQMLLAQATSSLSHFHQVQTTISHINYCNNLLISITIYACHPTAYFQFSSQNEPIKICFIMFLSYSKPYNGFSSQNKKQNSFFKKQNSSNNV